MRICVFGAGAVGGHLAAKLGASGHDVSVIARGAHLEAMRTQGVTLLHGEQTIRGRVRASERAADLGEQDFVLVTLKANLLQAFARGCAPLLGRDTAVVFVQNGIPWWYGHQLARKLPDLSRLDPGGELARAVSPERVVGAVVFSSNEVDAPGVIRNLVPGRNMLVVGEPDNRETARVVALRKVLDACDMYSPPTKDIRQVIWSKLVLNLGTSILCVLTGETVGGVRGNAELAALTERLKAEGQAIAAAYGLSPEGAPERPGGGRSSGMTAHKPSMLQDYERGRPMEIDAQITMPLEFARAAGVPAPTLEALAPLLAQRARARQLYA
ncbi:MAG TPA: 2-dehydropantoate 2-reductase [Burkholderiales bacterium]